MSEDIFTDRKSRSKKYQRKTKTERKIRTTLTPEKIDLLNKSFQEREKQVEAGKPTNYLKELGKMLNLGYSTILHKYR
jgi:hypothetical protein